MRAVKVLLAALAVVAIGVGATPVAAEVTVGPATGAGPIPTDAALPDSVDVGDAPTDTELRVGLVLDTQRPASELESFVQAVTDPASPFYGNYLSVDQVRASYGASQATVDDAIRALAARGVAAEPDVTHSFLNAPMTVAQAESIFGVDIRTWSEPDGTQYVAPEASEATPDGTFQAQVLNGIPGVTGIAGLSTAPVVEAQAAPVRPMAYDYTNNGTPQGCPDALTTGGYAPNQFRTAYDFDSRYAAGFTGAGQSIALLEIDGFSQANLDTYTACFGLPSKTPTLVTLGGGPHLTPGPETQLDVQTVAAMAPDLQNIHIIESPNGDGMLFADLISAALDPANTGGNVVKVFSMSLGSCENYQPIAARSATTQVALAAAATGVSLLVSSGDSGSIACYPFGLEEPLATVSFPASVPWVTAVGGTNLQLNSANQILDERVWNDQDPVLGGGQEINGGGGGYSVMFETPQYQLDAGIDGAGARVVPDVAMYADIGPGTIINCDGAVLRPSPLLLCPGWITVGGTSFAAPLLASAVVLANQEAEAQGKPTLGFLNPMLYREGEAGNSALLRDVTQGNNDLTNGDTGCCSATVGFDPASGWGSVNAHELSKVGLAPVDGYLMTASDGGVFTFGDAPFYGSLGGTRLAAPVVTVIERPQGDGYWLIAADGGVFAYGQSAFYGSTGSYQLDAPIVDAAVTPDGEGYWLVGADGGVFAFGSAQFSGSLGGLRLNAPIVSMSAAGDNGAYILIGSDGGVFTFGGATYFGSTGGIPLNAAMIGVESTPTGDGYWLLAADGGVFTFGDAGFFGSTGGVALNQPIVAFGATSTGKGYWLTARDGGVFTFGDAVFAGSLGGTTLNAPIVAAVSA